MFKSEEDELIREDLEDNIAKIPYVDNQNILNLLEANPGIFRILDEVSAKKGNDSDFLQSLVKTLNKNELFSVTKANVNSFFISHTAGQVNYSTKDFVQKNSDDIKQDTDLCLSFSKSKFVSLIAKQDKS